MTKQQKLAEFLRANKGQEFSMEQLMGVVWPDGRRPADPLNVLRVMIYRLRNNGFPVSRQTAYVLG